MVNLRRKTDSQKPTLVDSQRERERQTDRHSDRQTDTHTDRQREIGIHDLVCRWRVSENGLTAGKP